MSNFINALEFYYYRNHKFLTFFICVFFLCFFKTAFIENFFGLCYCVRVGNNFYKNKNLHQNFSTRFFLLQKFLKNFFMWPSFGYSSADVGKQKKTQLPHWVTGSESLMYGIKGNKLRQKNSKQNKDTGRGKLSL